MSWTVVVVSRTVASPRHRPQTWTLDFGGFLSNFSPDRAGDLAWRICVRVIYEQWTHGGPRRNTCSDGVSEVLAGKASLFAKLLFNPEWEWWHFVKVDGAFNSEKHNSNRYNKELLSCTDVTQLLFHYDKYFFEPHSPEQLVVLGQTLRSARCTCLDLGSEFTNNVRPIERKQPEHKFICTVLPVQCRDQPPDQRWRCPLSLRSGGWPSHPSRCSGPSCS